MCKNDKYCINVYFVNDNDYKDCYDKSDETKDDIIDKSFFYCKSDHEQISIHLVCNFIRDCSDGSDENLCGLLILAFIFSAFRLFLILFIFISKSF